MVLRRAPVHQLDLGAHLEAQLRVEVGQRLVEQEQRRVARQRAAHRDTLALAAGELAGLAIEQVRDLQQSPRRSRRSRFCSALGTLRISSPNEMFSRTRHVRIERIGLEHHRDVAVLAAAGALTARRRSGSRRGDRLQPGDHVQQGRLAAARAADQDQELALVDLDVDALQDIDAPKVLRTSRIDSAAIVFFLQPLTAPAVSPRTK